MTIVGNVWLQSDSFLPSGNRKGDTIVDGNLRIGNAPAFTMNGLRGRGTITLNNSYTSSLVVGDNDSDGDFEGNINRTSGTLSFRKIGQGTQRIGGSVTMNGPLAVENGTLLLDGDVSAASLSVDAGAAFGGGGTIAAGGISFTEGAKFVVLGSDDVVSCMKASGSVTGDSVTVDANEGIGLLELRNNDTELWATPKISAFCIIIR